MVLSIIELHDLYRQKFGCVPVGMVRQEIVVELFSKDVKELYDKGYNKTEVSNKLNLRSTDISSIESHLGTQYCRDKRIKNSYDKLQNILSNTTTNSCSNTTNTVAIHVCGTPEQQQLEQENKILREQLRLKKLKEENEKLKRELNK